VDADIRSPLEQLVGRYGPDKAGTYLRERYGPLWQYQWRGCWARPKQLPPDGPWRIYMYLGGRGSGKTRTASEWVRERVEKKLARRVAFVARTSADARDVLVEGEGGILSVYPPHERPLYEPSKRRITWANGAIGTTYSAEEASSLRGPQHDTAVADELAAWEDVDAWDQLLFGLRLGTDPRVVVTTTPRAKPIIKKLLRDPLCVTVRASTFENRNNLAPQYITDIVAAYEGTRLGRQEIFAEVLEDAEGALWTTGQLEKLTIRRSEMPEMVRVVVGVDPSKGKEKGNDEQGIVACGQGKDGLYYVIDDKSCKLSPEGWGGRAVELAARTMASCIVVERNAGGDMAGAVIQHAAKQRGVVVRIKPVLAKTGKGARAEPIAALYEQGKVRHAAGLEKLEEEMCHMTPGGYECGGSPNHLDAMCLMEGTLVRADGGDVPIERIAVGDFVLTSVGWRPVTAAWCSAPRAETLRVATKGGRVLEGTAEHKILTARGWQRLDAVLCGDTVFSWKTPPSMPTSFRETPSILREFVRWLLSGTEPLPATAGIPSTPSSDGRSARRESSPAKNAVAPSPQDEAATSASARRDAADASWTDSTRMTKRRPVQSVASAFGGISTSISPGLAPDAVVGISRGAPGAVYDLTVDGPHDFFAGGLLVHNCWAMLELTGVRLIAGEVLPDLDEWVFGGGLS
jgi:phage terminase large subunit-like protein